MDAPNHTALLGDTQRTEKKSAKENLEIIDVANSRTIPNVCHLPDSPWFSLQTTWNT
jgi:hypothetical protein